MIRSSDLDDRAVRPGWIRRRGRPRLFEGATARVVVQLPAPVYDVLDRTARQSDRSVPDVIRQLVVTHLP